MLRILLIINILLSAILTGVEAKTSLILDQHPNAKAAYSLRKLRDNYAGSALRIRRSCDDQEVDIGFDADGKLDTTSIETFMSTCMSSDLPLDIRSDASFAYSLRKLKNNYTGFALEIRRADNDNLLNVGFDVDGNLDTASIAAHCSAPATDCTVKTWYDQSSNGNHATAADTNHEALIFDSSTGLVLDTDNQPALKTDGYYDIYQTGVNIGNNHTVLAVATKLTQSNENWNGDGTSHRPIIANDYSITGSHHYWYIGTRAEDNSSATDLRFQHYWGNRVFDLDDGWLTNEKLQLSSMMKFNAPYKAFKNNIEIAPEKYNNVGDPQLNHSLYLFGDINRPARRFAGLTNEIIFYNFYLPSFREDIAENMGSYYKTSNDTLGYVVKWYDQSENGFDATQTDHSRQALIYKNGMVLDQNSLPAVKSDGVDDYYQLGFSLNETHSMLASVTRGEQTSGGSTSRPLIANSLAGGGVNYIGYGTSSDNDSASQRLAVFQDTEVRVLFSNNNTWNNNEKIVFSAHSDADDLNIFKNLSSLAQSNDALVKNFGDVYLFGTTESTNRYIAGLTNELIIYEQNKINDALYLQNLIGDTYNILNANFNGAITLANDEADSGVASGTIVTSINTNNIDNPAANHEYILIENPEEAFYITDDKLYTNKVLDFNLRASYPVLIRSINPATGKFVDQIFTIIVKEPKFNGKVNFSFSSIYAGSPKDTLVTSFNAINYDDLNAKNFDYELIEDAAGSFYLKEQTLYTKKTLIYNPQEKLKHIRIKAIDLNTNKFMEQSFKIMILRPRNTIEIIEDENETNDGQDEDSKVDDVLEEQLPNFIDTNSNSKLDFGEVVTTLAIINKSNSKHNQSQAEIRQKLDFDRDGEYTGDDLNNIFKIISQHENFDYAKNLLAFIGHNIRGQVTFRRASKALRRFKKIKLSSERLLDFSAKRQLRIQEQLNLMDFDQSGVLDDSDLERLKEVLTLALAKPLDNSVARQQRIRKFLLLSEN